MSCSSSQHCLDHSAMHVRELSIKAVVVEAQAIKVDAEDLQHSAIELPDVRDVLDSTATEFIRGSVASGLHASAHHPSGKGIRIVIATRRGRLMRRHPTELGGPDDERIFKQAALFEISQQGRCGLVEGGTVPFVIRL